MTTQRGAGPVARLIYHAVTHRQGSASRLWQSWCTVCAWHSELSRHEDAVTEAGAMHVREANGIEPPADPVERVA